MENSEPLLYREDTEKRGRESPLWKNSHCSTLGLYVICLDPKFWTSITLTTSLSRAFTSDILEMIDYDRFITAGTIKTMHLELMLASKRMLPWPKLCTLVKKNLQLLAKLFYFGNFSKECVSFALCSLATVSMTIGSPSSHGVAWELSSSQFHWNCDGLDEGCTLG